MATITAAFALPWIPKAAPDLEIITAPTVIHFQEAGEEKLELGDPVYLDENGHVRKWHVKTKEPIFGRVNSNEYRLDLESMIGGMIG